VVWSDPCTEVSGTTNTCTDPSTTLWTGQAGTAYEALAIGMSKHIITKSKMIVDGCVDAAGIGKRAIYPYQGRSSCLFKLKEKSAEVIVVVVNEACQPYFKRSRVQLV
jgi:hypothetical protein